jgi:hypothetical protein
VAPTQDALYADIDLALSWSERDLPERERTKHVHRLHPMDLAEKITGDATSVTRDDNDRLRAEGLDDGEIVSVVLAAAVRCFFSKALDAQPDASYAALDPALRDVLTVGRPIASS